MKKEVYDHNWQAALGEAKSKGLKIIDYGWEQHVILDPEASLTYRYPKHDAGASKLMDELEVLEWIHQQSWPLLLPEIVEQTEQYTAYKYISGEALTQKVVASLNDDQFAEIGRKLGEFLAQFHKLDSSIVRQKQTSHKTSLIEYYEERITKSQNKDFKSKAVPQLEKLKKYKGLAKDVVVHGDLHGPNLIIDPSTKKLVGIIDLSEMEIGDPHHEFRKIFMTFPKSLNACLKSYEDNGGQKLNLEAIKLWAYVNEWANACYYCKQPENYTYQRALKHLKMWGQL